MYESLGLAGGYAFILWLVWKILDFLIRVPVIQKTDQKFVLITGCDSGFGKTITKQLDRKRYHVLAGCLTEKGASKLRQETSARVATFLMDVTKQESLNKVFDFIKNILPIGSGLWAVVNNAGIAGPCGPTEWLTTKDFKMCLDANVLGAIRVCNTFLPLVKKERGRVVNVSCIFGRVSQPWMVPYSVSKYALEAYTDSLRREMMDFDVSVHLIEPSFFRTDFCNTRYLQENLTSTWNNALEDKKQDYGEDYFHSAINAIPVALDFLVDNDISLVIEAYEHAITALFPRARYVVGNKAKYFHLFMQALPEQLGDLILHLFFERNLTLPQNAERQRTSTRILHQVIKHFVKQCQVNGKVKVL